MIKEIWNQDVLESAIQFLHENSIDAHLDDILICVPSGQEDEALEILSEEGFLIHSVVY